MSTLFVLSAVVLLAMPWSSSASCLCSISGDPHITTCDTKTNFAWQGAGAYSLFKTPDTELQCDFDYPRGDNGSIIHQMFTYVSSCRLSYKTANGCEFTMLTGGNNDQQSIYIGNTKMTLSEVKSYLQQNLPPMGVNVDIDVANAKTTCTMQTQQGPISYEIAPYQVHVTSASASQCSGMCGTCDGKAPLALNLTDATSIRSYSTSFAADGSSSAQPIQLQPLPIGCLQNNGTSTNGTMGQNQNSTNASGSSPSSSNGNSPMSGSSSGMPGSPAMPGSPSGMPGSPSGMSGSPSNMPGSPSSMQGSPTSQSPMNPSSSMTSPSTPMGSNGSSLMGGNNSFPTPLPVPVALPNPQMINDNPVFESQEVLQQVVNQCLCGQPKARYYKDAIFGRYFENCVYDKSFPGAEQLALSNMMTLYRAISKGFTSNNASMAPMDINVCKQMILQPSVTKRPDQIPLNQGVSYVPIYTKQNSTGLPDLRPIIMTGTGETVEECEINQSTGSLIIATPAPTNTWTRNQNPSAGMPNSQMPSSPVALMSSNGMSSNNMNGMNGMTMGNMVGRAGMSGMMGMRNNMMAGISGGNQANGAAIISNGGMIGHGLLANQTNSTEATNSTMGVNHVMA